MAYKWMSVAHASDKTGPLAGVPYDGSDPTLKDLYGGCPEIYRELPWDEDGIPDSWRMRYFGTVYNYLSVSNADADGDGYDNWHEYVAGTDPTDPASRLVVAPNTGTQTQSGSIQWPSVVGKQYVVLRSPTLFPAAWTPVANLTGTGSTMEFDDSTAAKGFFYRVQVQ